MKLVCPKDMCTGCGACVQVCSRRAISIHDSTEALNACINTELCVECGKCEKVCQQNTGCDLVEPQKWFQGWSNSIDIRKNASSGGVASAIIRAFIHDDGEVCSCVFDNGRFTFRFANNERDAYAFAGSKYVKSNTENAYTKIREKLRQGKKVLFIGLPCQVVGLLKFVSQKEQEKLYTIDLICHGTPSPKVLERYLSDRGIKIADLSELKFRIKSDIKLSNNYVAVGDPGVIDRYSFSFLKQITYTENCYHCKYASTNRAADVTLGDSWGSELEDEKGKGISLILCQSSKGEELLNKSDLSLLPVNAVKAVENNTQLKKAAVKSDTRERFFSLLSKGVKYDKAVFICFPSIMIRQDVRSLLVKLKLFRGGGG